MARPSGPGHAIRASVPDASTRVENRVADALDRIAVTLAAIDHNLELLVDHLKEKPR
jgi:hypothetical protein